MRIQTFTVVVGSNVCNATCPYCVSKMTGEITEVNVSTHSWRNFKIACRFAKMSGVSTVLITGKGEPTLYPALISEYLRNMNKYEPDSFPFKELQTNGIQIGKNRIDDFLSEWYDLGMTTICVSMAHYDVDKNAEIFGSKIDLRYIIDKLHRKNFSVRLTCVLTKGYIDSDDSINELINFSKKNDVEQLTLKPVTMPDKSDDEKIYNWTKEHSLGEFVDPIHRRIDSKLLMNLVHGGRVYDVGGQNVCVSNCLTLDPEEETIRQLIFFPDGHLKYDWQYEGASIL